MMTTNDPSRRQYDPFPDDGKGNLWSWALTAVALLIVIWAMMTLTRDAKANEIDAEFENAAFDVERSKDILDDSEALLNTHSALVDDLIAFAGDLTADAENSSNTCTQTARLGYVACGYQATARFWSAQAACTSKSGNALDLESCRQSAYDAFDGQTEQCEDVRTARESLCGTVAETQSAAEINPNNFINPLDIGITVNPNPYFPLTAGTMWTYEGGEESIRVEVLSDVTQIAGIPVITMREIETEEDENDEYEQTDRYFAQDTDGNVWLFGETEAEYEDGRLDEVEETWRAGANGAEAGIYMPADPMIGMTFRQGFELDESEDVSEIISTTASETVPAASCAGTCVVIREYSPLEPGESEFKTYAPGFGLILETEEDGDDSDDDDEDDDEDEDEDDDEDDVIRVELIEFASP